MSNVFTASLITRFNACAAQWIYQAFGAFCLIRAWTQWRTEGFWRLGRRWELAPLSSACQTGKRKGALPRYWGVWGGAPATNAFGTWEQLGVNGAHFWIALTPFSIFRVRLARAESALLRYWRVWGGAPAANAFGSIWMWMEPFSE